MFFYVLLKRLNLTFVVSILLDQALQTLFDLGRLVVQLLDFFLLLLQDTPEGIHLGDFTLVRLKFLFRLRVEEPLILLLTLERGDLII